MIEIIKPKVVRITDENQDPNYGHYVAEPLERGYGITLGNSLRRVLLSSIPGVAPVCVKIDGVLHEFQVIEGVTEDMVEIILNLKKLLIKFADGVDKYTVAVKKSGRTVLTGADFIVEGQVEILNPELEIARIDREKDINFEVTFMRGRGYKSARKIREYLQEEDITRIFMDADFSPIERVNYRVEDTRVGYDYDYEKLELQIWTDGTIEAETALNTSVRLLQEYFNFFATMQDVKIETVKIEQEEPVQDQNIYDIPVKELEFSVRSRNCLKRANIKTIGELTKLSADDLLSIKNFGRKSLTEIREKLRKYGLSLKGEENITDFDELDEEGGEDE
jgi:DNA-directed RNA polymerase subunit alpha